MIDNAAVLKVSNLSIFVKGQELSLAKDVSLSGQLWGICINPWQFWRKSTLLSYQVYLNQFGS